MTKFEEFWAAFPNRKGKGAAVKKYEKIDNDTHTVILLAITAQKRYRSAAAKTGEFVPEWCMPSTWLTQQRWLDEIASHADLREKADAKLCSIDGCQSATLGSRFAVCEYHLQFSPAGRLLGHLGLVQELRAHYNAHSGLSGLRGEAALSFIKSKMAKVGK